MRRTNPLVASTRSASRTGLRLTPNSRHSPSSVSRCSGGYCQAMTLSLSVATIELLKVEALFTAFLGIDFTGLVPCNFGAALGRSIALDAPDRRVEAYRQDCRTILHT